MAFSIVMTFLPSPPLPPPVSSQWKPRGCATPPPPQVGERIIDSHVGRRRCPYIIGCSKDEGQIGFVVFYGTLPHHPRRQFFRTFSPSLPPAFSPFSLAFCSFLYLLYSHIRTETERETEAKFSFCFFKIPPVAPSRYFFPLLLLLYNPPPPSPLFPPHISGSCHTVCISTVPPFFSLFLISSYFLMRIFRSGFSSHCFS